MVAPCSGPSAPVEVGICLILIYLDPKTLYVYRHIYLYDFVTGHLLHLSCFNFQVDLTYIPYILFMFCFQAGGSALSSSSAVGMTSAAEEASQRVSKRQRDRWEKQNGWKRKRGGTAKEYFSKKYFKPENHESWYELVKDGHIQPVKQQR